jgi:hypothetical protein
MIARMLLSQDPSAALVPAIRNAAKAGKTDAAISDLMRRALLPSTAQ